ncbi:NADP-dependent leukotriene B4 12-hydroxydehydrogenase [Pyrenophora tritici-repentis Pt-1C-BFP]|uniref:NADP-dependent leukotriene B4 12-hydroxydehydrogenase n=1 Tax=Pyrenophora tritici-repentis (strain Pt-1C-BFP) TaxID=426418 RepID=B2WLB9_PYRTR|nr:NADP-dependent leukotriene B4 12-hydroxydehydrogenase [Pyrenophora tritici-repentis Pt-1C-BFP]EDU43829.1 NADP-dependent leukotriene B4 12-hydroxydehydrogenase [Pyrenophora tritici-repentis Pt-1C-BFP]
MDSGEPAPCEPKVEGDDATFKLLNKTLPVPKEDECGQDQRHSEDGVILLLSQSVYTWTPSKRVILCVPTPIGEIVTSSTDKLPKGQLVMGDFGWTEYTVQNVKAVRPIQADESAGIRPTHFIGSLGGPGITAYAGLIDTARATASDTVVVSGAAGATGSMVVQLAKHVVGCKRVIGIAGGPEKCKWVESLGADICVDYKSASFEKDLKAATEGFVEVYFDNVGGDILSLMLSRMKRFGRIAACGAVATYNSMADSGVKNWFEIISNRLEVKGFIVIDAITSGKAGPWIQEMIGAVKEGKIRVGEETETVVKTKFEDVPKTWMMLFEGGNRGKLVTEVVA